MQISNTYLDCNASNQTYNIPAAPKNLIAVVSCIFGVRLNKRRLAVCGDELLRSDVDYMRKASAEK